MLAYDQGQEKIFAGRVILSDRWCFNWRML